VKHTLVKVYVYYAKFKIKIVPASLMLHIFCVAVQYTQNFTFSSLHSIYYYSLLLHISATGYDNLQVATKFIDIDM
jgi:hypothetical protein